MRAGAEPVSESGRKTVGATMRAGAVLQQAKKVSPEPAVLPKTEETKVVPDVVQSVENVCEECGFIARSKAGLAAHLRSHS